MSNEDIVINVKNISKTFSIKDKNMDSIRHRMLNLFSSNDRREIHALKNISFQIKKGEFFGIIGHNGCGKSTLLKLIIGAFPPDEGGSIEVNGKIIRLALGMGFDPTLTARDNIYVNASMLGLTFKRIGQKFNEVIEFAELEDFVDTKVKFFSSGMRSRLAFSIALHAEADIFLMDEFFGGVGDIKFRKKSEEVFKNSLLEGRTIIHVSHNMGPIKQHCDRVLLLHKGKMVMIGKPSKVIPRYRKLMQSVKKKKGKKK